MINRESPISVHERILVRDAVGLRPIMTSVREVSTRYDEFGAWQQVRLKSVCSPLTSYEMSTGRRLSPGVYSSRDGRFAYLRTSILGLEEMSRFFNNGARQLAEELIRELTKSGLLFSQEQPRPLASDIPSLIVPIEEYFRRRL